jgi:2-iminobutanoate/2-iminopropanoate deaminase
MKIHGSDKAPKAVGPYSQAVASGNLLFLSGQIPLSPETGEIVGKEISEQTEQVIKNISSVLSSAGVELDSVIKTTCLLKEIGDFDAFNKIYAKYFPQKPARSCFAVSALPKGALVEIEVIAELK